MPDTPATGRGFAESLDRTDPLRDVRDRFVASDDIVYMDGNSLGRMPREIPELLDRVAGHEWAEGLVESWEHWIDLPQRVGALLAPILGAAPEEVTLADSTSVNLYKLASAALAARPGRPVILTDSDNFPTDRYVLEGLAAARGGDVRVLPVDPVRGVTPDGVAAAIRDDVALASFSLVSYRSSAYADAAAVTAAVQSTGAMALWDLSHAVGAVPIDLAAAGVDLAVGCTYKYLNGGPGAPAFQYVRGDLHAELEPSIRGWFGHVDQFAFDPAFRPAPGIERFLVGTPPVLSCAAALPGIAMVAEVGIEAIRAKSTAMTGYMLDLYDAVLAPLGVGLGTPRDPDRRGSHVAFEHPEGLGITRWMRAERRVVADFRAPTTIRLAAAPLYTTYLEIWDAVDALHEAVAAERWRDAGAEGVVT
jgi:kynureninase